MGIKMYKIILLYLAVINFTAFVLYGLDKRRAVRHQYRIPERTLIGIAVIGGSVGAFLGMQLFRHKTRHPKFFIGVPVIIVIQAAIAFLVL